MEERKIIHRYGNFERRVFCKCGWNYSPSFGDPWFGPTCCPDCGNHHGRPNGVWALKDGWFAFTGQQVKTGIPTKGWFGFTFYRDKKWMWDVVDSDITRIPEHFLSNVFDRG